MLVQEPFPGVRDLPFGLAQRPRRPVAAAQLVQDRALDPRPGELLQARAVLRVVAVQRTEQSQERGGEKFSVSRFAGTSFIF